MPGFPFGTLDGYLSLCDKGDAEKQRWQSGRYLVLRIRRIEMREHGSTSEI